MKKTCNQSFSLRVLQGIFSMKIKIDVYKFQESIGTLLVTKIPTNEDANKRFAGVSKICLIGRSVEI